jgi:hypothetical protein
MVTECSEPAKAGFFDGIPKKLSKKAQEALEILKEEGM